MKLGFSQRWVLTLIALSLLPIILVMALPMTFPHRGSLAALPAAEVLDYLTRPGRLQPLSPRFIAEILGGERGGVIEAGRNSTTQSRGFAGDVERLTDVHPLNNDDLTDARLIPSIPFTAKTDNRQATRDSRDPSDCGSAGGTVWYRYRPTQDLGLIAYTFGSDHAISLGVFEGTPGNLRMIRCDSDAAANALVGFAAKAGRSYYFQVAAPLGGGNLVFSLDPHGTIGLASVSSSGESANGGMTLTVNLSADGRFVVFSSYATNLAPGLDSTPCSARDPQFGFQYNGPCPQIFLRDRLTGTTSLISANSAGEPGNSASWNPYISPSGRFVTYESAASNLDPDDPQRGWEIFVHDRLTRRTERLPTSAPSSVPRDYWLEQYAGLLNPAISDDGRYVAFESQASHLVPGDNNDDRDVFVFDRQTKKPERVSVSSSGEEMRRVVPGESLHVSMTGDGRYIAFKSDAANLVPGDKNGKEDIFLHDRFTRTTERISISFEGREGNDDALPWRHPTRVISEDGRYVAFPSKASNLVPGDRNNQWDMFVRDRVAKTTVRVSVSSAGQEAVGGSDSSSIFNQLPLWSISADGRYVAFDTAASNLAPGDNDQDWDVFLHDLLTQTTRVITLGPGGEDSTGRSPAVSGDGSVVAFVAGPSDSASDSNLLTFNGLYVYEAARRR